MHDDLINCKMSRINPQSKNIEFMTVTDENVLISSKLKNNKIKCTFVCKERDDDNKTRTITHIVTFPDGYYNIHMLNRCFQKSMENNKDIDFINGTPCKFGFNNATDKILLYVTPDKVHDVVVIAVVEIDFIDNFKDVVGFIENKFCVDYSVNKSAVFMSTLPHKLHVFYKSTQNIVQKHNELTRKKRDIFDNKTRENNENNKKNESVVVIVNNFVQKTRHGKTSKHANELREAISRENEFDNQTNTNQQMKSAGVMIDKNIFTSPSPSFINMNLLTDADENKSIYMFVSSESVNGVETCNKPDKLLKLPVETCLMNQTNALKRMRCSGVVKEKIGVSRFTETSQHLEKKTKVLQKPLVDKLNNQQFSQQGAVSSSTVTVRKKYDEITCGSVKNMTSQSSAISGEFAYSVPFVGYSPKMVEGYSNVKTPVISGIDGALSACQFVRVKR